MQEEEETHHFLSSLNLSLGTAHVGKETWKGTLLRALWTLCLNFENNSEVQETENAEQISKPFSARFNKHQGNKSKCPFATVFGIRTIFKATCVHFCIWKQEHVYPYRLALPETTLPQTKYTPKHWYFWQKLRNCQWVGIKHTTCRDGLLLPPTHYLCTLESSS